MTRQTLEKLRIRGEWFLRFVSRRRGMVLRGLLCWAIGCLALSVDEVNSYDLRFNLRGEQKANKEIVILNLYPSDFLRVYGVRTNSLINVSEITDITDSFFWDKQTWLKLLGRVLKDKPKSIGVTLWFGENIGEVQLSDPEKKILQDPRVIWSTSINNLERMMNPNFSLPDLSNIGSGDLRRDDDGIVRRIFTARGEVPHLLERITKRPLPQTQAGLLVNYRGSSRVFTQYTLSDLQNDEIPEGAFKDKIVLIGADSGSGPRFLTPIGPLPRAEILAHMLDNHISQRWIKRLPFAWYALFFLAITIASVFLITTYPQSVVLLFFVWIGTLLAALSAWSFDTFAIWIPALSPFVLLGANWIIFIGYQATKIERLNMQLQQEQRSLQELEQLKSNFVSLISHDLKTPIAKIQAVVNRLLPQHQGTELRSDLETLHASSEELHRYIQSILKVLRVESRDFRLHREVADINDVIEDAVRQLQPLARDKSIQISTQLEPMFSSEFDVTLIKEVVINLIENAIKYSPSGSEISIRSEEREDRIHVEVQDKGHGIARDELEKVWQKFVRGKEQDMKTKGTGLGLYLVKYFIELHGGSVRMDSELGKGSTVSFTLPISDDMDSSDNTDKGEVSA